MMSIIPFTDEETKQAAFVALCGGHNRAAQLESIWRDTNGIGSGVDWRPRPTREQIFSKRARRAGFTPRQIRAFMEL